MIVEAILAAVTTVTVAGLALANALDRRERERDEHDEERERREAIEAADPHRDVRRALRPFTKKKDPCPMCGGTHFIDGEKSYYAIAIFGCTDKECSAYEIPHLHEECGCCDSKWMTRPAVDDQ